MKNIEELFKKANKDKIAIDEHKNSLKKYLINSEYFNDEKRNEVDFKLAFASAIFSVFIIAIAFIYFSDNFKSKEDVAFRSNSVEDQSLSATKALNESLEMRSFEEDGLYNSLIKKDNVIISEKIWRGQEVISLEILEGNLKTTYYFNKSKNLLLHSEALEINN
ncbi:MAG: hypothetical protein PHY30_01155 [Candidatus Pacebacteria bacterium]|nr:hypothetical protein [Candidatus Paceibacterota bacterium]